MFGVIEERAVTIVLDIRNMSPQQFDLYKMALERVIYEQVTQIAKFNLIRYGDAKSMTTFSHRFSYVRIVSEKVLKTKYVVLSFR